MDIISIQALKVPTIIGVYPHERQVTQTLNLDIEFSIDADKAAQEDDLNQTVDYEALSTFILEFGQNHQYKLLESFATKLIQTCLDHFPITWMKLQVKKPHAVKQAACICISLERSAP